MKVLSTIERVFGDVKPTAEYVASITARYLAVKQECLATALHSAERVAAEENKITLKILSDVADLRLLGRGAAMSKLRRLFLNNREKLEREQKLMDMAVNDLVPIVFLASTSKTLKGGEKTVLWSNHVVIKDAPAGLNASLESFLMSVMSNPSLDALPNQRASIKTYLSLFKEDGALKQSLDGLSPSEIIDRLFNLVDSHVATVRAQVFFP